MNKLTLIALSLPLLFSCSDSTPTLPNLPTLSEIKENLPDMPDIIPDLSIPTPFEDDVLQGSVLDRYSVNQLKIGMTKSQVTDLIGSPSIIDLFHNTQWDYINFSILHQKEDIRYRLTLKFKGELLSEIDTSGLGNLPPLTPEEQALEDKRIEQESAAASSSNSTDKKDQAEATAKAKKKKEKRLAQEAKITKEKAKAEAAAKAKKKEEKRLAQEAKIAKEKNELMRYKIKKGDTLSAIAKKYHTSIINIKTINELINDRIRADDYLFVPFSRKVEEERIAKEKSEAERLAKEKAEAEEKRILEETIIAAQKEEEKRLAEEAKKPWYQFW